MPRNLDEGTPMRAFALLFCLTITASQVMACASSDGDGGSDDAADTGDATDGTDGGDTADATDGEDGTDATDSEDATDGTDATDSEDGTDATDATDTTDGTDGTDSGPSDGLNGAPCDTADDCAVPDDYLCVFGMCARRCLDTDGNIVEGACDEASQQTQYGTAFGCPDGLVICMPGAVQNKDIDCQKDEDCAKAVNSQYACAGPLSLGG